MAVSSSQIDAQSCLAVDIDENFREEITMPSNWQPPSTPKVVKVYYHSGTDNLGDPDFDEVDIAQIHTHLNTSFDSSGFEFVYDVCSINYWTDPSTSMTGAICVPYGRLNHQDGLDIYLQSADLGGVLLGCTIGIPGDAVLVCNRNNGIYNGLTSVLPHEVGHALGLYHTFHHCEPQEFTNCSGVLEQMDAAGLDGDFVSDTPLDKRYEYTKDPCRFNLSTAGCNANSSDIADIDNYMSYYWGCNTRFSTGQKHRMHELVNPNILVDSPTSTITLDFDQTFDYPAVVGSQISIVNNATVSIMSDIVFDEASSIYVGPGSTLIVDGATLSACPDQQWKGIEVYSGVWNPAGEVILKGATIADAEIGVNATTSSSFQAWPGGPIYHLDFGGGKVFASDGTTFRDCDLGIHFGPYASAILGFQQVSTIDNCIFDGCYDGIQFERSRGVSITGTDFINSTGSIYSESSGFMAEGCDFYGQVYLINTSPSIDAPQIIDCNIYGNNIWTEQGISQSTATIDGCNFFCDQNGDGVWMESYNDAVIERNSFYDCVESGIYMSNTGVGQSDNRIQANLFDGGLNGVEVAEINDYEFLQNCFVGMTSLDIELNDGRVRDVHGDPFNQLSAGNCFSRFASVGESIGGQLYDPATDVFTYLLEVENFNINNCKNPQDGVLYDRDPVEEKTNEICGNGGGGYIIPSTYCDLVNCDSASVRLDSLSILIEEIESDTALTDWYQQWLINRTKRCMNKLLKQCSKGKVDDGDRDDAVDLLEGQDDFRYKAMAYGVLVQSGDLEAARILLLAIPTESAAEEDYLYAQGLYLDYLENESYEISEEDDYSLRSAALRRNVYSSAARGIYYRLTGERLQLPRKPMVQERSTKSVLGLGGSDLLVFPNPASDQVSIEATIPIGKVALILLDGRRMTLPFTTRTPQKATIDLPQGLASGLYVIQVTGQDGTTYNEKLMIQR